MRICSSYCRWFQHVPYKHRCWTFNTLNVNDTNTRWLGLEGGPRLVPSALQEQEVRPEVACSSAALLNALPTWCLVGRWTAPLYPCHRSDNSAQVALTSAVTLQFLTRGPSFQGQATHCSPEHLCLGVSTVSGVFRKAHILLNCGIVYKMLPLRESHER